MSPLSTIVKQKCSVCSAVAIERSRIQFGDMSLVTLQCGHVISEDVISHSALDYSNLRSSDNKQLMPFQIEAVKFAEKANCRVLIADEQGLGKTVEALAILKLHLNELLPVVIATKATTKKQWMREVKRWTSDSIKVQILFSGKEIAVPGMDVYITSYAMLAKESVWQFIEPKSLILDECQQITNHLASRSKGAQRVGLNCEYVIGLSGTPIRNHAGEYFTILNLIQPKLFPTYDGFVRDWCDSYESAYGTKVGGIKDVESWKSFTEDFIIRRTQQDVLPELAALQQPRKFYYVELDPKLNKAYEVASRELEELFYRDDEGEDQMTHFLAIMNRMRQITGISKTIECADFVSEFLLSTDRKICIFAHHHAAVDLLEVKINSWLGAGGYNKATICRAGDDSLKRIEELSDPKSRVMILSGLAAGEGMDGLQNICSDMIVLERFWNPSSEEQIEKRLVRMGQTKPVNITYMIAAGTIDDFFTELVEVKRSIVSATLDGKIIEWQQGSLLNELVTALVTHGKKKWSM